jgi:two-component system, NtrC family, C4-dicarboxylate transport sensor histidine kinase DctB
MRESSRTRPFKPAPVPGGGALGLVARMFQPPWSLLVVTVVLLPVIVWGAMLVSRARALDDLRIATGHRMNLQLSALQNEMRKYHHLPLVLADDTEIKQLFRRPKDLLQQAVVNTHLERTNEFAGVSDTYIMAPDGTTLAASNWDTAISFVGQNFRFRPYFQAALKGQQGRYFALGTTSGKRGYYLSAPIMADGQTLGVAVVKLSMERLESVWAGARGEVMVTDANGVVLISNRKDWLLRTTRALSSATKVQILESRQYGGKELHPLVIHTDEAFDDGTRLLSIPTENGRAVRFLSVSGVVSGSNWTFTALTPLSQGRATVVAAALVSGLLFAVLGLAATVAWQRRLRLADQMRYQTEIATTLEKSRDDLEVRVLERTRELRKTRDELIQAGKMAVLGQIASGINHELNQPLGAIRAYAENARAYLKQGSAGQVDANLGAIADLTERLGIIVGRLKTFSRKTSDDNLPIELNTAIGNALAIIEARAGSLDIEIECQFGAPDVLVVGDAIRLEQVFVNLLSNAIDSMEEGPPPHCLMVRVSAGAKTIRISVEDNGAGIAEGALAQLFDPFFTTKEIGRGLGLGLSITYEIVTAHGGTIRADNRDGGGARFIVELPTLMEEATV